MPVSFLTEDQRQNYGRYVGAPSAQDLARYFHLDDTDHALIAQKRGVHNKLRFAVQLGTVRYLGTFLEAPVEVPEQVLQSMAKQLHVEPVSSEMLWSTINARRGRQQAEEIRKTLGYGELTDPTVAFRLSRWLFALCWTGTDRPSLLFDRATSWLTTHKVLLPGCSVLERYISRLRDRVEERVWTMLTKGITPVHQRRLEDLLAVPAGSRASRLETLRTGPVMVSRPALIRALKRLGDVRDLGIRLPAASRVPATRVSALARFATVSKVTAIRRLPRTRRIATLVAFVQCLEATAQDDALEILEVFLRDLFSGALQADKKARQRSLRDLDRAAATLVKACRMVVDLALPDAELRSRLFKKVTRPELEAAIEKTSELIRPIDNVYFDELDSRYRTIRRLLPVLVEHIRFGSNTATKPLVAALEWLSVNLLEKEPGDDAPQEVITKGWKTHVVLEDGTVDLHAYAFCVLDELQTALKRREVFVSPSWRYGDPRAGLIGGSEWTASRPLICRTLDLSPKPGPTLKAIAAELDQTYRAVAGRLPSNAAVRFEFVGGKQELILSPLDKLDEPDSFVFLQKRVAAMLPKIELPELILEIAARTRFPQAFTHVSESAARASDLDVSLCAVLMAEACNTGLEPLIQNDVQALKRDRLSWVDQNYVRDETLTAANEMLVAAHSKLWLTKHWGGGEIASADGMRFTVPVKTVHAGPNPKYFGRGRGVTWYNLISDQFSGLNDMTVPGTLRDSLILLAVVLDQQTDLKPTQIMSDTGAYSDVVFGLFRLLGFRFSPRLADVFGTRFWRINPRANYGPLNDLNFASIRPFKQPEA